MLKRPLSLLVAVSLCCACTEKRNVETAPWGETTSGVDSTQTGHFTLSDMQQNGEMIMLTLNGPDTYFEYHGRGMGTQFLLCEKFAQHLGLSLRVEVCKDTAELISKLNRGDGDIIAIQLKKSDKNLDYCGYSIDSLGTSWAVCKDNVEFSDSLRSWYKPKLLADVQREEKYFFSARSVQRHTYSPMLNAQKGIISNYDHLFQKYAMQVRWDWRLLAAQCYQESAFDTKAKSWAGACGLMQIMPNTAKGLGLAAENLFEPEPNIAAAAIYIQKLTNMFRDIPDANERINFVLASYNGGFFHIRDAMTLAKKHGGNPQRWADVSPFVLKLSDPAFYRDPDVKYGYMRGSETVGYVERIRDRWAQYRGVAKSGSISSSFSGSDHSPRKAKKKNRFSL